MDFSTLLKAADAFLLPPKMLLLLMGSAEMDKHTRKAVKAGTQRDICSPTFTASFITAKG